MHIAISKSPETGSAEITPNTPPEPDENREIIGIEIPEAGKFIRNSVLESAQAKLLKMDFDFGILHLNAYSCVVEYFRASPFTVFLNNPGSPAENRIKVMLRMK